MIEALELKVEGIVQGVGFRPFVYRLAKKNLITGWVMNAVDGVHIHAEGESKLLDEFVLEISEHAPAAAQVKRIDIKEVPLEDFTTFEIRRSDQEESSESTLVSPDLATCDECVQELFDPQNPRYRYPFINCTNCGPRYTIIESLPYDRPATSMKAFVMCPACATEYQDPGNRRFHAQPNACFECGPVLGYWEPAGGQEYPQGKEYGTTLQESDRILSKAVSHLLQGKIVAMKGLGGYHLACDGDNGAALAQLRTRKHRPKKPFAVMMPSVEAVSQICFLSSEEEKVLTSAQRPIVLLRKRPDVFLSGGLADDLCELGVMLPYTPLQHLVMHDFVEAGGRMLVMTSGNLSDEPIAITNQEAVSKLSGVADAFLTNNRPILARFDDSVVRVLDAGDAGSAIQMVRRARGYAPQPVQLDKKVVGKAASSEVLAVGPEQKNTFALVRGTEAFLSAHLGDLENEETYDAWIQSKNRYEQLFYVKPTVLACDLHPEYLSTKWAKEQQEQGKANMVVSVQHHHAHVVSVMAENGLSDAVCGIAFDGTGYGVDGAVWGGEVMLCNLSAFERFANLAYIPMPGGAAAVKEPLRMAYAALSNFDLLEHPAAQPLLDRVGQDKRAALDHMIETGLNTPFTSSLGRLFDAAAALLGLCDCCSFDAEAAMLLEACAASSAAEDDPVAAERYEVAFVKNIATAQSTAQDTSVLIMDPAPVFQAMLDDLSSQVPTPLIARRFHDAVVRMLVQACTLVNALYGITTVVLSGGVFANRYIMEKALQDLSAAGFTIAISKELPCNDGGLCLGQAVVALNQ